MPSQRNINESNTKSNIQVIEDFNDQNPESLLQAQRDLRVETYFSNQNLEPPRSMTSNRGGIIQTYQSAGTSQAQQKNFTFNDTTSSQPKQLLSTQRSNILDIANRQSPLNNEQFLLARNFAANQVLINNTKQGFEYQGQRSGHSNLLGAQILASDGGLRPATQLQRFQQLKPNPTSLRSHQEQSHHQQAATSLSASSAKSGAQGISQSLMYLNKNREKLQQTQSAESLAKHSNSKSPPQMQQLDNNVHNYGYYVQPFQVQAQVQQQQQQMQSRTPTNFANKVLEQRGARSSSGNRGRNYEIQMGMTNPQVASFQQQRNSQVDPYNTPFFFNTRNFKRNNDSSRKGLNLIVPISSNSLVVDDYNPNYSAMNKRVQLQGFSTGHKQQSRNQHHLVYSPATQPVFSTQKKQYRVPVIPVAALSNHQSLQQNLSQQTIRSEIESVKQEVLKRKIEQLEREEVLNRMDQEILSSQQVQEQIMIESESSEFESDESLENSNFQSSSETEVKRQKRQQQRQRYRQANERRPPIQAPQYQNQQLQSYNHEEDENGIILITADNEDGNQQQYSQQQQHQQHAIGRPPLRIHPQYINTESSHQYTSESAQTALQQEHGEVIGSSRNKLNNKQIRLRRQNGQFRVQNQKYNMNQVQEISMSGYSSSKNHSLSNASSIRFDTRPKLLLLILIGLTVASAQSDSNTTSVTKISCPTLSCDAELDHNVCYQHDGTQPVRQLRAYSCETYQEIESDIKGAVICEFDLTTNKYAWVNESVQNYTSSNSSSQSILYKKKTQGYCRGVEAFSMYLLNNGRSCMKSSQCYSQRCKDGVCKGLDQNEFCNNHGDCDSSMYCSVNSDTSKCTKLKTSYEVCNETQECSIAHYCWFANVDDRRTTLRKQCLPLYSQDDGTSFGWYSINSSLPTNSDYEQNGRYCKSGLAFPVSQYEANCTSVNQVIFNNNTINLPYKCDPTDNNVKCQLWFNTTGGLISSHGTVGYDYMEFNCACALDGDSGYCSSLLGTSKYQNAKITLKALLEQSNCHTLDRNNFRAQRDVCGVSADDEQWIDAVQQQFSIKYWPYIQVDRVKSCINQFFSDSYDNLLKSFAQLPPQMTLQQSLITSFPLAHDDFVHDVSYDYYGKRLATCSSDQKIRIWEKVQTDSMEQQEEWKLTDELAGSAGHAGAVWKVTWADPEFGQIIASCGYDKQVFIWEEVENKDTNKKSWMKRSPQYFKDSVQDIKFAPKHWGLMLAVAVGNGNAKIYEAKDLNNLNSWTEVYDIKTNSAGCNCLSWNPAFDEPQMFVVGCNEFEQKSEIQHQQIQQRDQLEIMEETLLQIFYKKDSAQSFNLYSKFRGGHTASINDVAWAPLAGRSFHMIASCSKDKTIIVWKVITKNILTGGALYEKPEIEQLNRLEHHNNEVWRLSWNLLGTCFASSGDDGTVRVWKKSIKNKFAPIAMNADLWGKVHKNEFKVLQQMQKKKRNEKRFAKKLVRLAKYLELKGISGQELASMLQLEEKQDKIALFEQSEEDLQISDIEQTLQIKQKEREKKRKEKKESAVDDTESDSDFDNIKKSTRGEKSYLEDYMTLGELGGKIPPSLLINVNFEKFAKENGFDPIDYEGNTAATTHKGGNSDHKKQ